MLHRQPPLGERVVRTYCVYILACHSRRLYIGATNDLARRLHEHRRGDRLGFTARYRTTRLVYFETTTDVRPAIAREQQLEGWARRRKLALIESVNPDWTDLAPAPHPPDSSA
jgi:putative endonuclease